jgi:hypothetical protein
MSNFRREYSEARKEGMGLFAWFIVFAVVGGLALLILHVLGVFGSVATAPGRVVSRTLDTDNIITKYEWFHDANGVYVSRVAQIKAKKRDMTDASNDAAEKYRLRTELGAMQQSCRDLANRYNANATKTNQSIFMGRDAPTALNPSACE